MFSLKTSAAFDSAHFLAGYNGKCANLHGHRWQVEVTVQSETLCASGQQRGMLIDFHNLKAAVKCLADRYDHALIYEEGSLKPATVAALQDEQFHLIAVPFRPTAEHFAKAFFEELSAEGLPVRRVTVYETPDNCAVYEVTP